MLKLMIVGRRKPGTTLTEHRRHIRQVHGEAVLGYIATEPAAAPQRYVQNAVFDGSYRGTPVGADPFALNRDFVTQIWVADFGALKRSRETAYYRDHLQADEDNFVDQATVAFMPVRERVVSAPGTPLAGAVKLFGFLQRAPGTEADAFAAAWAELAAALQSESIGAQVQNDVLAPPGAPLLLDGIDEFWLSDEAAARHVLAQWQALVQERLVGPGLVAAGSAFALLATEDVVHDGPR